MTEIMQYEQPDNGNNYLMPVTNTTGALARYDAMKDFVQKVLTVNTDYGVIPGTGAKPTLLKPGAEKLCALFGLAITYDVVEREKDWTGIEHGGEPFFYFHYRVRLMRGTVIAGEGEGSCNSWEKKYRYRSAERVCPACGKATIIKGKAEYGGGWLCFAKKGGCGAKYGDNDPAITGQATGQTVNLDIADQVNTIQKMAQKRALVAATLNTVNAFDFFTQDLEDGIVEGSFAPVDDYPPHDMPPVMAYKTPEPQQRKQPAKKAADRPLEPEKLLDMLKRRAQTSNPSTAKQDAEIRDALKVYLAGDETLRHAVQMFLLDVPSLNSKEQPADGKRKMAVHNWLKPREVTTPTGDVILDIDEWAKREIDMIAQTLEELDETLEGDSLPFD